MDIPSAIKAIQAIKYMPGYWFEAEDYTHRYEGAVRVTMHYTATDSNKYPDYPDRLETYVRYPLFVGDVDHVELYRRIVKKLIEHHEHEAREFFRVGADWDAPFHPHTIAGTHLWGTPEKDLAFSLE